jgi:EEF1A N-terminal glycine/lysine methyltransferase
MIQARCKNKRNSRGSWAANGSVTDDETDMDSETDGGISESNHKVESIGQSHNYGVSTQFLPVETLYSVRSEYVCHTLCGSDLLTSPFSALVPRRPIYDLMHDYLTLSWARFSKDAQSHTLRISKIL